LNAFSGKLIIFAILLPYIITWLQYLALADLTAATEEDTSATTTLISNTTGEISTESSQLTKSVRNIHLLLSFANSVEHSSVEGDILSEGPRDASSSQICIVRELSRWYCPWNGPYDVVVWRICDLGQATFSAIRIQFLLVLLRYACL
uniref:Uncharacterized protein n=1 Tax=Parascaris equorum TaxID=6256 RepID=A0A914R899_PAREQ